MFFEVNQTVNFRVIIGGNHIEICRKSFKKNNFKNYVYALIGKVIFSLMTVSLSLLLTFFIEVVEYKSLEKLTMGL